MPNPIRKMRVLLAPINERSLKQSVAGSVCPLRSYGGLASCCSPTMVIRTGADRTMRSPRPSG